MGFLGVLNLVVGSVCLAAAFQHLYIFLQKRDDYTSATFAAVALFAGLGAFSEGQSFYAETVGEYLVILNSLSTYHAVLMIALAWFIFYYTGAARRWLAVIVSMAYALAIIFIHTSPYGILFSDLEEMQFTYLPWGERIGWAVGPANPLRLIADIAWLLLIYMALESCVRLIMRGEKRRAVFLFICLFLSLGVGYLHGTLIDLEILGPPPLFSLPFLALIVLMSGALVSNALKAGALEREVKIRQRRWSTFMKNTNLLMADMDMDGRINFANPCFADAAGYSIDELLKKSYYDLIPEEDRPALVEHLSEVRGGAVGPKSEFHLLGNNGNKRLISWFQVLSHDEKGNVSSILRVGEDITDLRRAEQDLLDEKQRMGTVLGALNTGLWLLDRDFNIVWVNQYGREMNPDIDPVGKKCYRIATGQNNPCKDCGASHSFDDKQIIQNDFWNPLRQRWYQVVSLPIVNELGEVENVLESVTDITEKKQAEQARDQVMLELEELKNQLEEENIYLKEEIGAKEGFDEIVGQSPVLRYVLSRVEQAAPTDASVLIQGETGVGKELVARALHRLSHRADRPFIRINCSTLPANLVESELFGHESGAFTGATGHRKGRFELADKGTIFLDEVSEIPVDLQAKLLRVLQEGEFERVGSSKTIKVDVRVIAASNRDLHDEMKADRFRSDLFYRLNVYPITVPPLKQRLEDIPLLVQHFIQEIGDQVGKKFDQIPKKVLENLMNHDWPGNIRELRNVIERAVITSKEPVLSLPVDIGVTETGKAKAPKQPVPQSNNISLDTIQRDHIIEVLKSTGWRISGPKGAAKILGINPSTLRYRIKKLGISRDSM